MAMAILKYGFWFIVLVAIIWFIVWAIRTFNRQEDKKYGRAVDGDLNITEEQLLRDSHNRILNTVEDLLAPQNPLEPDFTLLSPAHRKVLEEWRDEVLKKGINQL